MLYRVNDIFCSLQGEGHHTGRAAVFVRFAGCNLRCPFCDTDFESYREMTTAELLAAVCGYRPRFIVLTGGEPTLQVDSALVAALQAEQFEVAMESNGTHAAPANLDWLTVSPKGNLAVCRCHELKVIFTDEASVSDFGVEADYYYLQPCDTGDSQRNEAIVAACVAYVKSHPQWRLSLQTHKLAHFK